MFICLWNRIRHGVIWWLSSMRGRKILAWLSNMSRNRGKLNQLRTSRNRSSWMFNQRMYQLGLLKELHLCLGNKTRSRYPLRKIRQRMEIRLWWWFCTLYKLIFKDQADADVACKEINGPNFRATLVLTA